jgi:hypothetical protein
MEALSTSALKLQRTDDLNTCSLNISTNKRSDSCTNHSDYII